ncbi:MAG: hypothetical protein ACFFCS_18065 [Candidatus Hodarchaeota archaeon]
MSNDTIFVKPFVISTFQVNIEDLDNVPTADQVTLVLKLLEKHGIISGEKCHVNWSKILDRRNTACIDLEPAKAFLEFIDQHVPGREREVELTTEVTGPSEEDLGIDFTILNLSFYERERIDLQPLSGAFLKEYREFLLEAEETLHHEVATGIVSSDDPGLDLNHEEEANEMNEHEPLDENEGDENRLEDLPSKIMDLDDDEMQSMVNRGFKNNEHP